LIAGEHKRRAACAFNLSKAEEIPIRAHFRLLMGQGKLGVINGKHALSRLYDNCKRGAAYKIYIENVQIIMTLHSEKYISNYYKILTGI